MAMSDFMTQTILVLMIWTAQIDTLTHDDRCLLIWANTKFSVPSEGAPRGLLRASAPWRATAGTGRLRQALVQFPSPQRPPYFHLPHTSSLLPFIPPSLVRCHLQHFHCVSLHLAAVHWPPPLRGPARHGSLGGTLPPYCHQTAGCQWCPPRRGRRRPRL